MTLEQLAIQRYVRRFNQIIGPDGKRTNEATAIDLLSKGAKYEELCSRLRIY